MEDPSCRSPRRRRRPRHRGLLLRRRRTMTDVAVCDWHSQSCVLHHAALPSFLGFGGLYQSFAANAYGFHL